MKLVCQASPNHCCTVAEVLYFRIVFPQKDVTKYLYISLQNMLTVVGSLNLSLHQSIFKLQHDS